MKLPFTGTLMLNISVKTWMPLENLVVYQTYESNHECLLLCFLAIHVLFLYMPPVLSYTQ